MGYVKRAVSHAVGALIVRLLLWFLGRIGPAVGTVVATMLIVTIGRHYLLQVWPHPTAMSWIGQIVATLAMLAMVGLGLLLFSSSIVATTRSVPLFTTAVEPFEPRPKPDLARGQTWDDWLKQIRLGRWQSRDGTGRPGDIAWMRFKGIHALVAGETDMGKSGVEWQIYDELEPAIDDDVVEVIQFDPKNGAEMWACEYMTTRSGKPYVKPGNFFWGDNVGGINDQGEWEGPMYEETFIAPLRREVATMRARLKELHGVDSTYRVGPGRPLKVIMIDEGAQMVRPHVPKKITNEIIGLIDTLCHQGRAAGFVVIVCTQYPLKDSIPFRDGLVYGICMPVKSDSAVTMVLGAGARQSGAEADKLPRNLPGIAYKTGSGARLLRVAQAGPDYSTLPPPPERGGREERPILDWGLDTEREDEGQDAQIYAWPTREEELTAS